MLLKDLNLSSNPLGQDGIIHITEAMSKSKTITSLNISHCNIEKQGVILLQKSLLKNKMVIKLVINGNLITPLMELKAQVINNSNEKLCS